MFVGWLIIAGFYTMAGAVIGRWSITQHLDQNGNVVSEYDLPTFSLGTNMVLQGLTTLAIEVVVAIIYFSIHNKRAIGIT